MTVLPSLANVKFCGGIERPARCMTDMQDQDLVFRDPIEHEIRIAKDWKPMMPGIIDKTSDLGKMTQ